MTDSATDRCCGYRCAKPAVVGFWCSEQCQQVWIWMRGRPEIADLAVTLPVEGRDGTEKVA